MKKINPVRNTTLNDWPRQDETNLSAGNTASGLSVLMDVDTAVVPSRANREVRQRTVTVF